MWYKWFKTVAMFMKWLWNHLHRWNSSRATACTYCIAFGLFLLMFYPILRFFFYTHDIFRHIQLSHYHVIYFYRSRLSAYSSMTDNKKRQLKRAALSVMTLALTFVFTLLPFGITIQIAAFCDTDVCIISHYIILYYIILYYILLHNVILYNIFIWH